MANTTQSLQAYLNSLSQLPGSVLYRNSINWQALPPGPQDSVLQMGTDGLPRWYDIGTYYPAFFGYNGTTTELDGAGISVTNSAYNLFFRFVAPIGAPQSQLMTVVAGGRSHIQLFIGSGGILSIVSYDTSGTLIFRLHSKDPIDDETAKYCAIFYDPATATSQFVINGQDADDTTYAGRVVSTGTLANGVSTRFDIARNTPSRPNFEGAVGAIGYQQTTLLDYTEFMTETGKPLPIDSATWNGFNGAPPVWHESGELSNNRGTAGDFTETAPFHLTGASLWS